MATMLNTIDTIETSEFKTHFVVIHPLDDMPEVKVDTENLGPMAMTASVRISLLCLRAYLVLMIVMVFYHVLDLAGLFGRAG